MGLKKILSLRYLLVYFLVSLASCKLGELEFDGLETPVYEAQISVAIAESSYSLNELILGVKDTSLTISEAVDGQLSITYEDSAEFVFEGSDLLILLADPSLQQEVTLQQKTIPLQFFNEFESGEVIFEEPRITYTVDNYYGVPIGILLDNIHSVRKDSASTTRHTLTGGITETPGVIAATPAEDIGINPTTTSISITTDNSSLPELFSFLPLSINNSIKGLVNPNSEAITGNVVGDNGRLSIKTKVELPLRAVVDSLVTIIDFDMNMGLSFGEADSVTLRIVTLNSTPLDGHLIMEFYTMDSVKVYDVPQSMAFKSATVGIRKRTLDPVQFIDDIPLDSVGVAALAETAYINAFVTLNSFKLDSRDVVSFFSSYGLDIIVTAIFKIEEEF